MAAHVYRIVGEIAFRHTEVNQVKMALDYAPGMGSFELSHYGKAHEIIRAIEREEKSSHDLWEYFYELLPHYAALWIEKGKPARYEDWN